MHKVSLTCLSLVYLSRSEDNILKLGSTNFPNLTFKGMTIKSHQMHYIVSVHKFTLNILLQIDVQISSNWVIGKNPRDLGRPNMRKLGIHISFILINFIIKLFLKSTGNKIH